MPLWERQEIQEMLRWLSAYWPAGVSHSDAPHTVAYPSDPNELNLRKTDRQDGNNRGWLQQAGRDQHGSIPTNQMLQNRRRGKVLRGSLIPCFQVNHRNAL